MSIKTCQSSGPSENSGHQQVLVNNVVIVEVFVISRTLTIWHTSGLELYVPELTKSPQQIYKVRVTSTLHMRKLRRWVQSHADNKWRWVK